MTAEKYRLDLAPHLLVPIHNKTKYEIIGNVTVQIRCSKQEHDVLEKVFGVDREIADAFYWREIIAKQVQEQVRKEFPKAAFANITYAHRTLAEKNTWEIGVEVDVLG